MCWLVSFTNQLESLSDRRRKAEQRHNNYRKKYDNEGQCFDGIFHCNLLLASLGLLTDTETTINK